MQLTPNKTETDSNPTLATAAYFLWQKAGQPAGHDQKFWLQAEAQLRKTAAPKAAPQTNGASKPVVISRPALATKPSAPPPALKATSGRQR